MMLWTASTTGIATCQITVAVVDRRESAYGYFRLFFAVPHNVRYTSKCRPMAAKAEFSAVFVGCTSTSGLDSVAPCWAGVDPLQTFAAPTGTAYFSSSSSAFASFRSAVSKPSVNQS